MNGTTSAVQRRIRSVIGQLGLLWPMAAALAGCSTRSAPALVLFGAYFPQWLLFGVLAVVVAIVARIACGLGGIAASVAFPLFTYLAIGILVAGAIDLLWLGR
jgi:hypothetical protein